ncbi:hypothetical protein OESDEN_04489 [Oesophagostomum dentatum]|uniref:Uncharacterized protein n=1 Tax=Oesophagostomum dentatum TaxID=61180 RepID=A0A0B1TE71_OESDE|nr:hypothetical protein OESDEN_04489 [Oesophagostomum dentatum]
MPTELFLVVSLCLCLSISCSDPFESLVRNVLLSIKGVQEKVLSSITIPTSNDVLNTPPISFLADDKSIYTLKSLGEYINTCPPSLPVPLLAGSWHVTYTNRKWLQTVLADLDEVINRLENGQPLSIRKPLSSVFGRDLQVSCMKVEFLDDNVSSRFELSYSRDGRRLSIVGNVLRLPDRSLEFSVGPTFNTKVVVAYSMQHSSPTPLDVLVLSQTDSFPKCENYLVLQRSLDNSRIVQILTSIGANFPSNPLEQIHCTQTPLSNNAIIKPLL